MENRLYLPVDKFLETLRASQLETHQHICTNISNEKDIEN